MDNRNIKNCISEGFKKAKPILKQWIEKYGPLVPQYIGNYFLAKKAIDNGCDVSTSISSDGINLRITSDDE